MTDTTADRTVVPLNAAIAQATKDGVVAESGQTPLILEQKRNVGDTAAVTPDQAPRSQPEGPRDSDPQPPRTRVPFQLEDIQIGKPDSRGLPITQVYAIQAEDYAIYQAGEVMVQFADVSAQAQAQKKSILPISSTRAEINLLLQGLACREVGDRQLAYALQLALDGDLEGAKATAIAVKLTVVAKRAARGRFQYLKWSYGAAALLIGLLCMASWFYPIHDTSSDLWLAAKAGLVGAAFSISLAIRGRTVAPDTDLLDNVTDGTLRLVIGVISAGVLLLLFTSGIVPSLKVGNADFTSTALTWQIVLVIGFVGGFLERLVPDLLEKRNPQATGTNAAVAPAR